MRYIYCFTILLLLTVSAYSQNIRLYGTAVPEYKKTSLDQQFYSYEVFKISANTLYHQIKSHDMASVQLQLGDSYAWDLDMHYYNLISPQYIVRTPDGKFDRNSLPSAIPYSGHIEGNTDSRISLTLDENFIYGYIRDGEDMVFIEPVHYFEPDANPDLFVVYNAKNVIPKKGATCGVTEMHEKMHEHEHLHHHDDMPESAPAIACYELDLAIASDFLMFQKFGSIAAVEAHNIGVMANVATNWDNEFNDEIQFIISEQFVSACSSCDPWSNTLNANTLLNEFSSWGATGFSLPFDLGQLWTNRDFNGPTIGIAWVAGVCVVGPPRRFHVLQDFTANANFLRVLTSHELGHNFSATHDAQGSPTIMAPTVNNTNTWSAQSMNQINAYYPTRIGGGCLTACGGNLPPVADFVADKTDICVGESVQFTDLSTNSPTSWQWTFPGGTPGSSTQQNPIITYNTPGLYSVTLSVNNAAGGNTSTKTDYINVRAAPTAFFSHTQNGLTVDFLDASTFATTWAWEFGDGGTSTLQNPSHTYAIDNVYIVTLTVTNDCGTNIYMEPIIVGAAPTAGFTSDVTEGCIPLSVQYSDASMGNVTGWLWTFPGGTPAVSTLPNPMVVYTQVGTYDVTLQVENPLGTDVITIQNYITTETVPTAFYSYGINGLTVNFTNQTNNGDSYIWNFGDMNGSTEENPTHTYQNAGMYPVTLIALNNCGNDTIVQVIDLGAPPQAAFSADTVSGCAPLTVTYTDQSVNSPTNWEWAFPGGDPDSASTQNPVVTYHQGGIFDVTLIVSNGAGTDTIVQTAYINIDSTADADFSYTIGGHTVNFNNQSVAADSVHWDFGDGATSTNTNPTHTYLNDGVYTVTLIAVNNNCGADTMVQQITIATLPQAGFTADVTSGCAPLTVQFTNQSSNNVNTFQWSFPGGNPSSSSDPNPTVTYNQAGTYSVTLIVSNSVGSDTLTQNDIIVVSDVPSAGFTYMTNGATVNFTNTSADATSYFWDFGDSTSGNQSDPIHTYSEDGTYIVMLIATNGCGDDTIQQQVVIATPPQAGFSADVTDGCVPLTVQFTNQSSNNANTFQWSFPGGSPSSSSDPNPTVTYNQAGTYSVTLIVSNSVGSDTLAQNDIITVSDIPSAGFTYMTNGATVDFTNTSVDATSYFWDFGDSTTSNMESPSHTYTQDGMYTVTLISTNMCGDDTIQQNIMVVTSLIAGFDANMTTGCIPFTVQFNDLSTSNAVTWEWDFEGGTPMMSNQQNPTVSYNTPGEYDVSLTVHDIFGNSSTHSLQDYIQVLGLPTAGFGTNVMGLTVNFNNTSQSGTSYFWDFGDMNNSVMEDPQHIYQSSGMYTVMLITSNTCGNDTSTAVVEVVGPPQASFKADNAVGCAPFTVQFTDQSVENITAWNWLFPGGNPASSADQNPTITYNTPGMYHVTLEVTNAAGSHSITEFNYIEVLDVPTAGFTQNTSGAEVAFNNQSNNSTSYLWLFGDGDSSQVADPTHIYQMDGTYIVELIAQNDCSTDSYFDTIDILTPPTAGLSVDPVSGCAPLQVQLYDASSENATAWDWTITGPEMHTSNDQDPIITLGIPGVYTVTLIASNAAGADTITASSIITVEDVPGANFTPLANQLEVSFTNNTTNGNTYKWYFGDGDSSMLEDPMHIYAMPGMYTVILIATNDCGSDTVSTEIDIDVMGVPPQAGFEAQNNSGCPVLEVQFTDMSTNNPTSWAWDFPGGNPATSTDQNPLVTYAQSGLYDVTLIATNLYGSDTITLNAYVTVDSLPEADFGYGIAMATVAFYDFSLHGNTYFWDFGDGNTSNMQEPTHIYPSVDSIYQVMLVVTNDCGNDTVIQDVVIMVSGIDDLDIFDELIVYPSPNDGQFTFRVTGPAAKSMEVTLIDVLGRRLYVQSYSFATGHIEQTWSQQHLPAGTYILEFHTNGKRAYRKVVVD